MKFTKIEEEGLRIELELDEARLLRGLIAEMRLLLEADVPATDAVKQRLFPQAYEDDEQADEFRSMVGDDLQKVKIEALRAVSERLGHSGALATSVPEVEVDAWLTLVTDLRLAIGTRLEITETTMEMDLDPEDPDAAAMSVMHWLGWVQESMLVALTGRMPDETPTGET